MDSKSSNVQEVALSTFQKVKSYILEWINSLNLNGTKVIELIVFFGVGFFSGFLLKKYFRYFLLSLIVLVVVALVLEHSSIIHIDWIKVREALGIAPTDTIDSVFHVIIDWVKANALSTVIGLLGFIIGYKVG